MLRAASYNTCDSRRENLKRIGKNFLCVFYNIVKTVRVKREDYRSRIEYKAGSLQLHFPGASTTQPHRIRSIQKTVDRGSRCIHSSRIPGQAEKPGGAQSPITRV